MKQGTHDTYNKKDETRLKCMLEEMWAKEEEYWRQRSMIQWLKASDRNTKSFHQATVEIRKKNTINRLQRSGDSWIERENDIMQECEGYFRKIFQIEGCRGVYEQLQCVPLMVDLKTNETLTRMVDREEVRNAVF